MQLVERSSIKSSVLTNASLRKRLLAWQAVAYIGVGVKGAAHTPQSLHGLVYIRLQTPNKQ